VQSHEIPACQQSLSAVCQESIHLDRDDGCAFSSGYGMVRILTLLI